MAATRLTRQRLQPARATGAASRDAPSFELLEDLAQLRPRGVGALLDETFQLFLRAFAPCTGFALLCWVPFQVVSDLLWGSGVSEEVALAWSLLGAGPEFLVRAFLFSLIGLALLRQRPSVGRSLFELVRTLPGLVLIAIFQAFVTFLGTCACLVPGLVAMWMVVTVPVVYVLERRDLATRVGAETPVLRWFVGIVESVRRSVRLVWGLPSFGRWLGAQTVLMFVFLWPLAGAPAMLEDPNVTTFLEDTVGLQGRPIEFAIALIVAAFLAVASVLGVLFQLVYYRDQRVRTEGLDLELRLARLEERAQRG